MFSRNISIFALLILSQLSYAAIYKWVDEDGNAHFTDRPPENKNTKKITVKVNSYQSVQIIEPDKKKTIVAKKPLPNEKDIVMYSAQWCGVCRKAKRYFNTKGIDYTELDIDKSKVAKQQYKALGATGIPVIFIDDTRLNGFSKKGFEKIYYQ